jgi:replication factor C subunit 1
MHGGMQGQIMFPSWLGQFSKEGKGNRQLKEIQIKMRLKISGDKNDVRQTYIPTLAPLLTRPLVQKGKVCF